MSDKRDLIVVDIETTGLDYSAKILEVAAVNVWTDEEMYFVPHVDKNDLADADPDALRINRYYERAVYRNMLCASDTGIKYMNLQSMLRGNTFAGSNPSFDAARIARVQWNIAKSLQVGEVWHHRLADLSTYAAGALRIDPTELPGLDAVCSLLGIQIEDRHSALGDAPATAECFRKLTEVSA